MKLRYSLILIPILILLVLFESAQQYYYVVSLDLIDNYSWRTFIEILEKQTTWWVIWLVTLAPLTLIILKYQSLIVEIQNIYKLLLLSVVLFSFTVLGYSISQYLILPEEVNFLDIIVFKLFQKAPISLIAYASVILILHLMLKEQYVEVLVENISTMENELDQLKSKRVQVLTTKIGDSRKVIKLEDVISIEADDYCVTLYLINDQKTTMRTSLKALESKLPLNFVRIHRKHIVNVNFIEKFSKNGNTSVTLLNDHHYSISKSRLREFESMIS